MEKVKALSKGEEAFYLHCKALKMPLPEREYRFCDRRWRFDFAWPTYKLAVEIEGGIWNGGRHTRGAGYKRDTEKYNRATKEGWGVLRYDTKAATSGTAAQEVCEMLWNYEGG